MPSMDRAIRIVPAAGGGAAFKPRFPYANPGDPLKAQVGDVVIWGNDTKETHQPWPTQGNTPNGPPLDENDPELKTRYLSDPILPDGSSNYYVVVSPASGSVINYCCKNHPTERGQIEIF
jgi:hypothetical protein